jgi:hypothetical protein
METADGNAWRLSLARQLSEVYAPSDGIAALGVTGSVSHGWADAFSDIELLVIWDNAPTESEREMFVQEAGGTSLRLFPRDSTGTGEWSEDYLVHDVKIDVSHYMLELLDRHVHDVVDRFDTSLNKQHVLAAIQFALPLYGEALFEAKRQQLASYPDGLRVAMVEEHCRFGPHQWVETLAARGEIVGLHDIFVRASQNLVSTLIAVNRIYHPGFKWLDHTIGDMRVRPLHMSARLQSLFRSPPVVRAQELRRLIEETLALVEETMPEIDTSAARTQLRQTRTVWFSPPPSLLS